MHLDEDPKHREEPIGSTIPIPPTREPRLKRIRGRRNESKETIRPLMLQKFWKNFKKFRAPFGLHQIRFLEVLCTS